MDTVSIPGRPGWMADLCRRVDVVFELTGASTPGWDDPHPDRNPDDDEYSRCLDPGKYRILETRMQAWCHVLAEAGVADTSVEGPTAPAWLDAVRDVRSISSVRRVRPTRRDGLTLLAATTLVDGEPFGVDLGVVGADAPPVFLETVPDCGCDACDSGSADLLETLDGWILCVARGGVVHAQGDRGRLTRTVDGWQGSGAQTHEDWLDETRADPPGVRRWRGVPWR